MKDRFHCTQAAPGASAIPLLVGFLLVLSVSCGAVPEPSTHAEILPDSTIQEQISRTVRAFGDIEGSSGFDRAMSELRKLEAMVGKNRAQLVQQLVLHEAQATDMKGGMLPLVILRQLEYSPFTIVEALAPYLGTADPKLLNAIRHRFEWIDGVKSPYDLPRRSLDYSEYRSYIANCHRTSNPVPEPFLAYIYWKAPGPALLAHLGALDLPDARKRSLLWAEHVVADVLWKHQNGFLEKTKVEPEAAAQLEKLSQDQTWWVRLYVAEILRQHPAFRTAAVVDRLKDDPHELVREAITRPQPAPVRKREPPRPLPATKPPQAAPGGKL